MKTASHRIVGTGLFALDVIVRIDGTQVPPKLGGSAGNVLGILGALGWTATPVGLVGDDDAGKLLRSDFASIEADLRFMQPSIHCDTPVIYQHQVSPGHGSTHRFSFACPHCGERRHPSWDDGDVFGSVAEQLPNSSVFFLDRPTPLGVALAEHYSASGAVVVFEPSSVGDDIRLFARAVRASMIVKYSDDRLDNLDDFNLGGVQIEIQTRGANGLRFRKPSLGDDWVHLGAYALPYIHDTSGAGDWCTAGMLYELFSGAKYRAHSPSHEEILEALAFGQALSTLNCMTEGARGLLSHWPVHQVKTWAKELSQARIDAMHHVQVDRAAPVKDSRLDTFACELQRASNEASSSFDNLNCCFSS
jgi:sugar/nucleoside kinase (ribokinase family)